MTKNMARIILFLLILCTLVVYTFYQRTEITKANDKIKSLIQMESKNKSSDTTEIVKWVYDHSTKIPMKVANEIVAESMKYKNNLLLLAIFDVESEFDPYAVSNKGAKGLGQINWSAHKDSLMKSGVCPTERDLFDIACNVRTSDFLVDDMLKKAEGDVVKMLRLYLGIHDPKYIIDILNNYVQLSSIRGEP